MLNERTYEYSEHTPHRMKEKLMNWALSQLANSLSDILPFCHLKLILNYK